jgi:Spx/MgsR family transcriptional regulator
MHDTITMYGIANCDTIKKARKWLDREGIDFVFHDYRKQGLDADLLQKWIDALGWEVLLNRRGSTWRKLPDDVKENIERNSAIEVMLENPAIIKRPLLDRNGKFHSGFSDAQYREIFER